MDHQTLTDVFRIVIRLTRKTVKNPVEKVRVRRIFIKNEGAPILTSPESKLVSAIHSRFPVILDKEDYAMWLDPRVTEVDAIRNLFRTYPAEKMSGHPFQFAKL